MKVPSCKAKEKRKNFERLSLFQLLQVLSLHPICSIWAMYRINWVLCYELCVQSEQCVVTSCVFKMTRILCYELYVQKKQSTVLRAVCSEWAVCCMSCVFKVNRILCWLLHCFRPKRWSEVLSLSTIPHQSYLGYVCNEGKLWIWSGRKTTFVVSACRSYPLSAFQDLCTVSWR